MKVDLTAFDPAMATKPADCNGVAWHLPFEPPMKLLGFPWFEKDHAYERLPIAGRPAVVTQYRAPEMVEIPAEQCGAFALCKHAAGGQMRFRTDSTRIVLRGELLEKVRMHHMPDTGCSSFDLYMKCGGVWKTAGVTCFDHDANTAFEVEMAHGLRRGMRDFIVNFPLYNGVKSVFVGLDEGAALEAPTPFADDRPIVFYGTSITQGGCAARPGMAATNILSRAMEREVINLGFSGSGKAEPEVIDMVAAVRNPALFVIDHAWNNRTPEYEMSLPRLLDALRSAHPDTPIVLVTPTPSWGMEPEFEGRNEELERNSAIARREVERRRAAGDLRITLFDAFHDALGEDYWDCLVDGCHLTDPGFMRFAKAIQPCLEKALADNEA